MDAPTQDPTTDLAASQDTDRRSDIQIPGQVVIHPSSGDQQARSVDLTAVGESADPQHDLRAVMTGSLTGAVELQPEGFAARAGATFTVRDVQLGAMWMIVVTQASLLLIAAATALVAFVVPEHRLTIVIMYAAMAGLLETGALYLAWRVSRR